MHEQKKQMVLFALGGVVVLGAGTSLYFGRDSGNPAREVSKSGPVVRREPVPTENKGNDGNKRRVRPKKEEATARVRPKREITTRKKPTRRPTSRDNRRKVKTKKHLPAG